MSASVPGNVSWIWTFLLNRRVQGFKGSRERQILDSGFWMLDTPEAVFIEHPVSRIQHHLHSTP
jgi:hypothetical protein